MKARVLGSPQGTGPNVAHNLASSVLIILSFLLLTILVQGECRYSIPQCVIYLLGFKSFTHSTPSRWAVVPHEDVGNSATTFLVVLMVFSCRFDYGVTYPVVRQIL